MIALSPPLSWKRNDVFVAMPLIRDMLLSPPSWRRVDVFVVMPLLRDMMCL